jgi:hypothetical protein
MTDPPDERGRLAIETYCQIMSQDETELRVQIDEIENVTRRLAKVIPYLETRHQTGVETGLDSLHKDLVFKRKHLKKPRRGRPRDPVVESMISNLIDIWFRHTGEMPRQINEDPKYHTDFLRWVSRLIDEKSDMPWKPSHDNLRNRINKVLRGKKMPK